jgi:tRNA nucleotidyltransferase (CCA-adding enzyme)
LADVVAREHGNIHRSTDLNAAATMRLLERCDAIRKPMRLDEILQACECDARGRLGFEESSYPQRARLNQALAAAQSVATNNIATYAASIGATGQKVGKMIHTARVQAVANHASAVEKLEPN